MKVFKIIFLSFLSLSSYGAESAIPPHADWATEAHWDLIKTAFGGERADCISKIKEGSEWVDSLANQLPSHSYMHAMRSGDSQSIDEAKKMMADFIQGHYEIAVNLEFSATEVVNSSGDDPFAQYTANGRLIVNLDGYLASCYQRGVALHPVMDSFSPAHAGFAIWSLTDIADILKHGDFPGSIENEKALLAQPDLMMKTVGMMQILDKVYCEFGMMDFRYE